MLTLKTARRTGHRVYQGDIEECRSCPKTTVVLPVDVGGPPLSRAMGRSLQIRAHPSPGGGAGAVNLFLACCLLRGVAFAQGPSWPRCCSMTRLELALDGTRCWRPSRRIGQTEEDVSGEVLPGLPIAEPSKTLGGTDGERCPSGVPNRLGPGLGRKKAATTHGTRRRLQRRLELVTAFPCRPRRAS